MAIKFQCPKCKTPYSVKDELAGKKAACKKCKEVITIPAPVAAAAAPAPPPSPPPSAEELAASVFADEPQTAPDEPTTVDFTCPECDAKLQLPAELAGKRTQCPQCKNLIKVPEIVKKEKLDWRTAQQRVPSGARQDAGPAPEGAWSSTAAEKVSREALVEAGAIPEEKEQLTHTQRAAWWAKRLVPVAVVLGVGLLVWRWMVQTRETRAVERALAAIKSDTGKWPAEARAEVLRGAGQFYLRTNQRGCVEKARANLGTARSQLAAANSAERDPVAIELALTQLDMGSSQDAEIDNRTRLSWKGNDLLNREIAPTLAQVHGAEARLVAIREVSRKLVEKGQPSLAGAAALAMFPPSDGLRAEGLALAGLEILKADPTTAEALANKALDLFIPPPPEPKRTKEGAKPAAAAAKPPSTPIAPSLVALCVALDKSALIKRLPPEARGEQGAGPVPPAVIAGNVAGLARKGDVPTAREAVKRLTAPLDRLIGYVLIAEAQAQEPPNVSKQDVDEAVNLALSPELKGRIPSSWLFLRLIRLGTRAGVGDDQLKALAQAVPESSGLQSWAQLEVLRGQLAAKGEKAEDDRASAVTSPKTTPKPAAHFLAWEAVARNNAHLDGGTLSTVEQWDELVRPFGVIGAVLGWQDGR